MIRRIQGDRATVEIELNGGDGKSANVRISAQDAWGGWTHAGLAMLPKETLHELIDILSKLK